MVTVNRQNENQIWHFFDTYACLLCSGYILPECYSGSKVFLSKKADVYSYGVMLLEIVSGRRTHSFEGKNFECLVEHVSAYGVAG